MDVFDEDDGAPRVSEASKELNDGVNEDKSPLGRGRLLKCASQVEVVEGSLRIELSDGVVVVCCATNKLLDEGVNGVVVKARELESS